MSRLCPVLLLVATFAVACSGGTSSPGATSQLDRRFCAAVRAWFVAEEIQLSPQGNEAQAHVQRVDAVRSTFVTLGEEYRQAGRSKASDQIATAVARMRDYEAVLTNPFAPHAEAISLSVYGALRDTGITCPSPVFPT